MKAAEISSALNENLQIVETTVGNTIGKGGISSARSRKGREIRSSKRLLQEELRGLQEQEAPRFDEKSAAEREFSRLNKEAQKINRDIRSSGGSETLLLRRSEINTEAQAQQTIIEEIGNNPMISWHAMEASAELRELFSRSELLLDETKMFADEKAIADYTDKSLGERLGEFKDAKEYHEGKATIMLTMMSVGVVAALVYIVYFANTSSAAGVVISASEGIIPIAHELSAHLAMLLFLGWFIRYAGVLHRSHSEQSVIYRDRGAALGVAQALLENTTSNAERDKILGNLAQGYLNFGQNAFRTTSNSQQDIEHPLGQTVQVLHALAPLAEAFRGLAPTKEKVDEPLQ